jgi:hypothetical protein
METGREVAVRYLARVAMVGVAALLVAGETSPTTGADSPERGFHACALNIECDTYNENVDCYDGDIWWQNACVGGTTPCDARILQ